MDPMDRMERPDWSALRSMVSDLQQASTKLEESQRRIRQIKGLAQSPDRLVKATVGPRGQLVDLELDPRLFRNPNAKAVAATIMATVRAAVEDSQRQAQQVRDDLLPKDLRKLVAPQGKGAADLMATHDADLEGNGA
jgi:DNA-binding protein YbaB